jgi:LysM repeat protein
MLIITSFNEWAEGSQIEPSVEYGNTYLDLTAQLIAAYRSGSLASVVIPPAQPTAAPPTAPGPEQPPVTPGTAPADPAAPVEPAALVETPTPLPSPTPWVTPTADPEGRIRYQVAAGDTLLTIGNRFETTVSDLLAYNSLGPDAVLSVGQSLTVGYSVFPDGSRPYAGFPQARIKPDGAIVHVIASGQTLGDVALTYGLSVEALNELNGLEPGSLLQIGQEITVGQEAQPEATTASADMPLPSATPSATPPPTLPPATPTATTTLTAAPTVTIDAAAVSRSVDPVEPVISVTETPEPERSPLLPIGLGILGALAAGAAIVLFLRRS